MSTVIVNVGSNKGDRRLNLSRAMRGIIDEFGQIEMSHAMVSDPWGFESTGKFLNVCILFNTELAPEEVLGRLQNIERGISASPHRNSDGSYADRVIDIDIVAIDDKIIDTERLKVPHPHLAERRFFLEPLAEVAPGWRSPVNGKTADEMLAELKED